ncbi:MAG: WD40/YVTN/BNR-like repeat-containing protein [Chlorobiota bacterium]
MKYIIFVSILLTNSGLFAEKQIELTPIVLPYDSLNIDEVYGYGATIIVRSGNTIYHSTDDGASWDIALKSETKLNQLYSKDPHTVFAIGDSGLVYRTFDYGATWFDVSHETSLSMNKMAAKNYSEYYVVTKHTIGYFKKDMISEYKAISNYNSRSINSVKYSESNYWYSTSHYKVLDGFVDDEYTYDYWLNYYTFNGDSLFCFEYDDFGVTDKLFKYKVSYNFQIFPSKLGLIFTGNNPRINSAGLTFESLGVLYEFSNYPGIIFNSDTIQYVGVKDSSLVIVTRNGNWAWLDYNDLNTKLGLTNIEHQNLEIPFINHVFQTFDNQYYLACDSSRVYKAKFVSIQTNINQENETSISISGNKVIFENRYELINATNYLGQKSSLKQIDERTIELEDGMHILKFAEGNKYIIKKVIIE